MIPLKEKKKLPCRNSTSLMVKSAKSINHHATRNVNSKRNINPYLNTC